MTGDPQRRTRLTHYLLGEVSQDERAEIEEEYLRNDELFEELVAAENDLIDDYVRGKLSGAERAQFEARFLSLPEKRERVQFARSLMRFGPPPPSSAADAVAVQRPGPAISTLAARIAWTSVLLAILAGFVWVALINRKLRDQLETEHAGQSNGQRQVQELRQQLAELQQATASSQTQQIKDLPPPGSASLSLTLVPDLARGSGRQITLRLDSGISQVLLLLRREHRESAFYDVVLETAEGIRIWQKKNLGAELAGDGNVVISVEMPPRMLNPGDYVLRLFRSATGKPPDELDAYSFRVVKP
jgi:anti-sigma factor RsiW